MAHQLNSGWGRAAIFVCLVFVLSLPQVGGAEMGHIATTQQVDPGLFVVHSSRSDTSPDLRSLEPILLDESGAESEPPEIPHFILPKALIETQESGPASLPSAEGMQLAVPDQMPAPLFNFEGVANLFGGWPPDTQGDIGPNHYVQWINLHFAVWQLDKVNNEASLVYGPVPGTTLFQGFGGACEYNNDGDPITLYDPFADRWFMSQFALPYYPYGPFYQCVAVSTTPNPLGSWYRYEYQIPSNKMNDYPKFGVWPNAYFMTVNQFFSGTSSWGGAGVAALERSAMLAGQPARMIYLDLYTVNSNYGGMLPADFDGTLPPPEGAPGYFLEWDDSSWLGGVDGLRLWEFHVDWDNPQGAVFGVNGNPNEFIPTRDVDPSMCSMSRNCIPQPGTSTGLDAISDRLMYRLQYRNFGGYFSLVSNHTVDADGTDHAGIHWFELRKGAADSDWVMQQEGVYAPDSAQRWMGSVAMDHVGNLALGYSLSSTLNYPTVRYTGRLAGDPPGSMLQGEVSLIEGSGSQTGSNRWGDYSMMGVDPLDDCTFWYTQQYVAQTGSNTWRTRIGAFRFPNCVIGDMGTIQGTVTSSADSSPIQGAQVQASASASQTITTLSDSNGMYAIQVPVGVYTLTASAYGYYTKIEQDVEVFADSVTTRDFSLDPAPNQVITGLVRDAQTGWPLYASLTPVGVSTPPVWTDPTSGYYSLSIPAGTSFTLTAKAYSTGYVEQSTEISNISADLVVDFDLRVDAGTCSALGYQPYISPVFSTDFESGPGDLTASGTTSWAWGEITSGPGSAHSGLNGWATGLNGDYMNYENGYVSLPAIDASTLAGQPLALGWWQWLESEPRYDYAVVEASKDGGSSWQAVYGPISGQVDLDWKYHFLTLDPIYAVSNLQIRYKFTSDSNITLPGWYLDDIQFGVGSCEPVDGGLVAGNVFDANTHIGLNGAEIFGDSGESAISVPTPEDASLEDGFYLMFSQAGTHPFTATYQTDYQTDVETIEIPLFGSVRLDFELQAGWLEYSPNQLVVELELGQTAARELLLQNKGGASTNFEWVELRGAYLPIGPIEEPVFGTKPFKADLRTAQKLGIPSSPQGEPLAAGQVLQSWVPEYVLGAWAVAYDKENETVWVSSPSEWWGGEDGLYEFQEDGTSTGRYIAHDLDHVAGPADLAYNWNTGKLWVMNINTGVANCIYEVDPQFGYTGEKICPGGPTGFTLSQRGLAYDPFSDTWFAGSWNDLMIHHFDGDGTVLSSVNVGLPVAGLAYQPVSQHLFVLTSEDETMVYVLDAADSYQLIGQFQISEGFGSYSGGGMEFDCAGNLWAVDINENKVTQFTSGEPTNFCDYDIPWISAQPVSGMVGSGDILPIQMMFDATLSTVDQPGIYSMLFKLREDTPYIIDNLPVTMTVAVPPGWGKLDGTVTSPGYCDADPAPLEDAQVTISSSQGEAWTVSSNEQGYYQRWLDEQASPFTITVTIPGYASAQTADVQITGGLTTTVDFDLAWLQPCVSVYPEMVSETVKFGRQVTATLTLENSGYADTPYTFREVSSIGSAYTDLDWMSIEPVTGTLTSGEGTVQSVLTLDAGSQSISQPGVYTAGLIMETQDPLFPLLQIPITFTVTPLEYGVQLDSPATEGQGIPGETVEYTLQVTNTSDGMQDTFQLQVLSSWTANLSGHLVGPLASGETVALSLAVTIPDSALPDDQGAAVVTVNSVGDPAKVDSLSITTSVLEPSADLVLQMAAPPDPYMAGQVITYTITISNNGTTSAPGLIYVNQLSPKLLYLSDTAGCEKDGQLLVCRMGWLRESEVRSFTISGIPISLGILLNQGAVMSGVMDPNMVDNFAAIQGIVEGFLYYLPWLPVN